MPKAKTLLVIVLEFKLKSPKPRRQRLLLETRHFLKNQRKMGKGKGLRRNNRQ
jgi:hypothetical protein